MPDGGATVAFIVKIGVKAGIAIGKLFGTTAAAKGAVLGGKAALFAIKVAKTAAVAYGIFHLTRDKSDIVFQGREVTVRSDTEPKKLVLGQISTAGLVMFPPFTAGETSKRGDNSDIYVGIIVAGHEVEDIIGFYLNEDPVLPMTTEPFRAYNNNSSPDAIPPRTATQWANRAASGDDDTDQSINPSKKEWEGSR